MRNTTMLIMVLVLLINNLIIGQDSLKIKVDKLKNVTDMPYICRGTIGSNVGCGQTIFWDIVANKLDIIPYLIDRLDDTTSTLANVPNTGGHWTIADIAYGAIQEIIEGIATYDLLGVPFDKDGCGSCSYWFHLRENVENRRNFKQKVNDWYISNKDKLIWIKSNRVLTCDCSYKHPNGGHFEIKK